MTRISSRLTARRRKEIASLGRKKYRDRLGQMLVEGVRAVEAAQAAQAPLVDLVVSEAAYQDPRVQAMMAAAEVPVYLVPDADMARLSDVQTSQGVLAVARCRPVEAATLAGQETVLAFDRVQDPGNVGAVIRTAAWFGIDAVLAGPGTADLFHPKVVRAAMGGIWDVQLAQVDDLVLVLGHLRAQGFTGYGADLHGTAVQDWAPRSPAFLVLGSEAHGLDARLEAVLAERVAVPGAAGRAGVESLNVAVAAGILVHAWAGKRMR